jgi:hypothetical protein
VGVADPESALLSALELPFTFDIFMVVVVAAERNARD